MIPKIGFLLGAGASKPLGIPTTDEMAKEFLEITKNSKLKQITEKMAEPPDIEKLINIVRRVKSLFQNEGFSLLKKDIVQTVTPLSVAFSDIENELTDFIRKKCLNPDIEKAITIYEPLLELRNDAVLKIFTTNYDPAIENVCKQKKIPFSDGFKFSKFEDYPILDLSYETERVQLLKLHGSVNWWSNKSRHTTIRLNLELEGLKDFKNLMIYPAQKDDLFNYPFNVMQSILIRTLHNLDEFVVIGHKFADQNIVSAIQVALEERDDFKLTIVNPGASTLKKNIFENNSKVDAIDKKIEDWIPIAMKDYRKKVQKQKELFEKESDKKYQDLKDKIIGEYESSKPQFRRDAPLTWNTETSNLFRDSEAYSSDIPTDNSPRFTGVYSSDIGILSPNTTCPKCGHRYYSTNLGAGYTCPACGEHFV